MPTPHRTPGHAGENDMKIEFTHNPRPAHPMGTPAHNKAVSVLEPPTYLQKCHVECQLSLELRFARTRGAQRRATVPKVLGSAMRQPSLTFTHPSTTYPSS